MKVFYISCNTRDGIKKLKQYVEANNDNIQLVGFPNTGKTTLLNVLAKQICIEISRHDCESIITQRSEEFKT